MSYRNYRRLVQLIDLIVLDINTLDRPKRKVILSLMYVLLGNKYEQFSDNQISLEFPASGEYLLDRSFAFNDLFAQFLWNYFKMNLQDLLDTIKFVAEFWSFKINMDLPLAVKMDQKQV